MKKELKKEQENTRKFYELGVDIEKMVQGISYVMGVVKG